MEYQQLDAQQDTSPVTEEELKGFYSFGWAVSNYLSRLRDFRQWQHLYFIQLSWKKWQQELELII
jgi:hypothetical protein